VAAETYETLLVEQTGRVVTIILNRPERRNAISPLVQAELIRAVEVTVRDPSAHAIVIRGAGKAFCAGYDVGSAGAPAHGEAPQPISLPRRAMETVAMARRWAQIANAPIAIIAQVHGHCLAGGTDLALNCDMVIVAEDATIGFPALRMGGTPPVNNWLYNVGPQWAKRLLFTGDTFTGRFAEQIGFALEAVPLDALDAHVMALATRVAAMGRDIVAVNKHVINRGLDLMGRTTLQEISAPMDSIANMAPEMSAFQVRVGEIGLSAAFKERDAPFAQGAPIDVKRQRE
jgi:enoyl-CoA hydratase